MTILQGTMQDGTVIPVQVDAQGRLVAEGLQGAVGPQGPQGPAGADGGSFALPAGAQDGDVLGWLNGNLAWLQLSTNAPLVTDVITAVKEETSPVYSTRVGREGHLGGPSAALFDGKLDTYVAGDQSSPTMGQGWAFGTLRFSPPLPVQHSLRLWVRIYTTSTYEQNASVLLVNNVDQAGVAYPASGHVEGWVKIENVTQLDTIRLGFYQETPYNGSWVLLSRRSEVRAIEIDHVILIDNAPQTELTFASAKDLARFTPGDLIYQYTGGPASGRLMTIDPINRTMEIQQSTGTWGPAGQGHRVTTTGMSASGRR